MKEIEILHSLKTPVEDAKKAVELYINDAYDNGSVRKNELRVVDTYFYSPKTHAFEPHNGKLQGCLRIRVESDKVVLTTKSDIFDAVGNWQYSNELNVKVENAHDTHKFIESLGFTELVKIDNTRTHYAFETFEVTIESVIELGNFIEIEIMLDDSATDEHCNRAKIRARTILKELKIQVGDEHNAGKPELLLRKRGIL